MIALVVEDAIEALGFEIVGPVARLDTALLLATDGHFDCAVLDINIRGGNSYAVAFLLQKRGCPFVLATGYSDWSLPKELLGEPRLTKPYSFSQLEHELRLLFTRVQAGRRNPLSAPS